MPMRFRCNAFAVSLAALLLALCLAPARTIAAEPVLTILFTGNTEGHYAPCPS